ncbi:hypothetical protein XELAEV_18025022mg [Xenopus laevis]|uniref:Uncharacterized protein n=1 Tax=Xenopus laevis TaxID=8355 RepID=A0A974D156_XENLA|nr:hypothetical protein XELAEV_18025022mg [Xenopus laevis]
MELRFVKSHVINYFKPYFGARKIFFTLRGKRLMVSDGRMWFRYSLGVLPKGGTSLFYSQTFLLSPPMILVPLTLAHLVLGMLASTVHCQNAQSWPALSLEHQYGVPYLRL